MLTEQQGDNILCQQEAIESEIEYIEDEIQSNRHYRNWYKELHYRECDLEENVDSEWAEMRNDIRTEFSGHLEDYEFSLHDIFERIPASEHHAYRKSQEAKQVRLKSSGLKTLTFQPTRMLTAGKIGPNPLPTVARRVRRMLVECQDRSSTMEGILSEAQIQDISTLLDLVDPVTTIESLPAQVAV